MSADYADTEFGGVISRHICPDCGERLVVEYREGMPASMLGLACPEGHVGLGVRLRDAAAVDEVAETERVPFCFDCQGQILNEENPPETEDGHPLHPGECAESHREDMRRLAALGGEN